MYKGKRTRAKAGILVVESLLAFTKKMAEENLLMMDDVYSFFMVHAMILMDAPVEFKPPKSDATLHKATLCKGYFLQAYVLVEIPFWNIAGFPSSCTAKLMSSVTTRLPHFSSRSKPFCSVDPE